MDKQKEIEEMAKLISNTKSTTHGITYQIGMGMAIQIAEVLFANNFAKIDNKSIEQHDNEVRKEFAEKIKANFISSAKNQELISVKKVLENVCTAKVDNLLKKYNGELK